MSEAQHDDEAMERLANRLALLVSDTGEADNAGRAVGSLARRMGLSGGDLKAMFLAGALAGALGGVPGGLKGRRAGPRRPPVEDAGLLARELSAVRHSLKLAEVASRNALIERDALRHENNALQSALDQSGRVGRRRAMLGVVLLAGSVAAAAAVSLIPFSHAPGSEFPETEPAGGGLAMPHAAKVRSPGSTLFAKPDRTGNVMATLPAGTKLVVYRLFWRSLMQWGEVDAAGRHGYVVSTEMDLS